MAIDINPINHSESQIFNSVKEELDSAYPKNGLPTKRVLPELSNYNLHNQNFVCPSSLNSVIHAVKCLFSDLGLDIQDLSSSNPNPCCTENFSFQLNSTTLDYTKQVILLDSQAIEFLRTLINSSSQDGLLLASDFVNLVQILSSIALQPATTLIIARNFPGLLPCITACWLQSLGFNNNNNNNNNNSTPPDHLILVLDALTTLCQYYSHLSSFLCILFKHPLLQNNPFTSCFNFLLSRHVLLLHRILSLVPLHSLPPSFSTPPQELINQMKTSPHGAIRYLSCRLVTKWFNLFAQTGKELTSKWVVQQQQPPPPSSSSSSSYNDPTKLDLNDTNWLAEWNHEFLNMLSFENGSIVANIRVRHIDVWALPAIESRFSTYSYQFVSNGDKYQPHQQQESLSPDSLTQIADTIPFVSSVHGVWIPRENLFAANTHSNLSNPAKHSPTFVLTPTAKATLRSLANQLSYRLPTLFVSSHGSGKTMLINELAASVNAQAPVFVSLSDPSTSAASLVGSLASSTKSPGKFVFSDGSLTRALKLGRWIVFRDVDKANQDVLVLLGSLAERMLTNQPPGIYADGRWIQAHPGFMLFATVSTQLVQNKEDEQQVQQNPSTATSLSLCRKQFWGEHYWSLVNLPYPSQKERRDIIQGIFETLHGRHLFEPLIQCWEHLITLPVKGRQISFSDLIKWCRRIATNLQFIRPIPSSIEANPIFQDEIFVDAIDVFLGYIDHSSLEQTDTDRISLVSTTIANYLNLSDERKLSLLQNRVPELSSSASSSSSSSNHTVQIGRANLPVQKRRLPSSKRPFAYTRPSKRLLEKLAVSVQLSEPVLMVGETGTGKTTVVSELARLLNQELIALNLSSQTEVDELVGGWKPFSHDAQASISAVQLTNQFRDLFAKSFNESSNEQYISAINKAVQKKRWSRLVSLFINAGEMAKSKGLAPRSDKDNGNDNGDGDGNGNENQPDQKATKRRKLNISKELGQEWSNFLSSVSHFDSMYGKPEKSAKSSLSFSFVEGPLVNALEKGHWILLDEINLASTETLEALSTILQSSESSITLSERGDLEPVKRHANFRLFACMNPATDIGKRDLPPAIRAKFSEFWVPPPDVDKDALMEIVKGYINNSAVGERGLIMDVAELYREIKSHALSGSLADGSNEPPHYSMRTLTRALEFSVNIVNQYGIHRSLLEGFLMAFTMSLDDKSKASVEEIIVKRILGSKHNLHAVISQGPKTTRDNESTITFGPFQLTLGKFTIDERSNYILTDSVQQKIKNLARVLLTRSYPVLIQGPTSSGKTSIIEYLANRTGHRFVRINNHEHTDIQEYIGAYVTDSTTGKLTFQEGVLVRALKEGHWIVLDELNLAPSDVLEALNRLLDDNRELYIPETQETIRPHPHFMLFATQNPPGAYGGRKALSRAFRNRFLEFHFDDVPKPELELILVKRCEIAPPYAKRIVEVFLELQRRRQSQRVFEQRQSFATLRDLFRWAGRGSVGYQQLAEDGYMLLAERTRTNEDKQIVKDVLETIMRVTIDENEMYDFEKRTPTIPPPHDSGSMVWTRPMRRLYSLVAAAITRNEPILLVGETGCGKTSVCQVVADALKQHLCTLNCHQNTETSDILGGQRPVRNRQARQEVARSNALSLLRDLSTTNSDINLMELENASFEILQQKVEHLLATSVSDNSQLKDIFKEMKQLNALFEWGDGPLVKALRNGDVMLLDEISLAEDSVLERLNSVLESSRTLVLAERGGESIDEAEIVAHENFKVVATMNPGGDYGKKELSPALRNRFTEIWVPPVDNEPDLLEILNAQWPNVNLERFSNLMLDFRRFYIQQVLSVTHSSESTCIGLRDLLSWAKFIVSMKDDPAQAFLHGALMNILDGMGTHPATSGITQLGLKKIYDASVKHLESLIKANLQLYTETTDSSTHFGIGPFKVAKSKTKEVSTPYSFNAPTVTLSAAKILRALQLERPVLLEGSPGVGKTSILTALASACERKLFRINLSDQTDLTDLFGKDLPVEGGSAGEFAWKNAEFLDAMNQGCWVLLDEMNLASQSVLEGLNSCLDHRGEVFIPELNASFSRHPEFRIFASQNPLSQGGARKGLPKSFVDRFTKVYISDLTSKDYSVISHTLYPTVPSSYLEKAVAFTRKLSDLSGKYLGADGAPWEFNLRDILRWFELLSHPSIGKKFASHPSIFVDILFVQRFRQLEDRKIAGQVFAEIFGCPLEDGPSPLLQVTDSHVNIGVSSLKRQENGNTDITQCLPFVPTYQSRALQALSVSVEMGWLSILTGKKGAGKTTLIRTLASLTGNKLLECFVSNQSDTTEILGSFEQLNEHKYVRELLAHVQNILRLQLHKNLFTGSNENEVTAESLYLDICNLSSSIMYDKDQEVYTKALDAIARSVPLLDQHDATYVRQALESFPDVQSSCRFNWVDGILVEAMINGHWLIIENANLCSASILDRLNAVFEPGGKLTLSERGILESEMPVITPHPSFRLFLNIDQVQGELSRAMRNRGVEINIDSPNMSAPENLPDFLSLPKHAQLLCENPIEYGLVSRLPQNISVANNQPVGQHWLGWLNMKDINLALRVSNQFINSHLLTKASRQLYIQKSCLESSAYQQKLLEFDGHGLPVNDMSLVMSTKLDPEHDSSLGNVSNFVDAASVLCIVRALLDKVGFESSYKDPSEMSLLEQSFLISKGVYLGSTFQTIDIPPIYIFLDKMTQFLVDQVNENLQDSLTSKHDPLTMVVDLVVELLYLSSQQRYENARMNVILEKIEESLSAPIFENSDGAGKLISSIKDVSQAIQPKTGRFMKEIWQAIKPTDLFTAIFSVIGPSEFGKFLNSNRSADLRKIMLEVGATISHSMVQSDELQKENVMDNFKDLVKSACDRAQVEEGNLLNKPDSSVSNASKSLLSSLSIISQAKLMELNTMESDEVDTSNLMEIAASDPFRESLLPLLPLQILNYANDQHDPAFQESVMELVQHVASPKSNSGDQRVHDFLQSSILFGSLKYRSLLDDLKLENIHYARQSVRDVSTAMAKLSTMEQQPRSYFLITLLKWSCNLIFSEASSWESLSEIVQNMDSTLSLHLSSDTIGLVKTNLPLLDRSTSADEVPGNIGLSYISIACLLWELYVPNMPIDPAASFTAYLDYLRRRQHTILTRLQLESEYIKRLGSQKESAKIVHLSNIFLQIRDEIQSLGSINIGRNEDFDTLENLFGEFRKASHLLSASKIKDRIFKLNEPWSDSVSNHITSFQLDLDAFTRRLTTIHGALIDITRPVQIAVSLLKIGFTSLAQQSKQKKIAKLNSGFENLVTFPKISLINDLGSQGLSIRRISSLLSSTLRVDSVHYLVSQGATLSNQNYQTLLNAYENVLMIWKEDCRREQKQREEERSLYAMKTQEEPDYDDEIEEQREFLELFPDYEGDSAPLPQKPKDTFVPVLGPLHLKQIVSAHVAIFANDTDGSALMFDESHKKAVEILEPALNGHIGSKLDSLSQSFSLNTLAKLNEDLGAPQGKTNFYLDSNVETVSKAGALVQVLREDVVLLTQRWPEHMILSDLKDRCDNVLSMKSSSSVAQVLVALERLLLHIDEWETYASKEVSLEKHQGSLTSLIVEWRRLELSSWANLLATEQEKFNDKIGNSWLHIYNSLYSIGNTTQDEAVNLLESLVEIIDTFLHKGPVGQFMRRMDLVKSFATFLNIGEQASQTLPEPIKRARSILYGAHAYYSQYSNSVQDYIKREREIIDKEVNDLIRLASWRDVNVQSLSQSAKRSHQQLHKCIRKFRQSLQKPTSDLIQVSNAQTNVSENQSVENLLDAPDPKVLPSIQDLPNEAPQHLVKVTDTLKSVRKLTQRSYNWRVHGKHINIENLLGEIITRSDSLRNEKPIGESPEEKSKQEKGIHQRKRRALAELLKALRQGGLSPNPVETVVKQQQNLVNVFQVPLIYNAEESHSNLVSTDKTKHCDDYFERMLGLLPQVNRLPSDHHDDISSADMQKMVGFIASLFGMVLNDRQNLSSTVRMLDKIVSINERLSCALTPDNLSSNNAKWAQCHPVQYSIEIGNYSSRVVASLEEIESSVSKTADFVEQSSLQENSIKSIIDLKMEMKQVQRNLSIMQRKYDAALPALCLKSDINLFEAFFETLGRVNGTLKDISNTLSIVRPFASSTLSWLAKTPAPTPASSTVHPDYNTLLDRHSRLINSILVVLQELFSKLPEEQDVDEESISQGLLREHSSNMRQLLSLLRVDSIFTEIKDFVNDASLSTVPQEKLSPLLERVVPFIEQYIYLCTSHLDRHLKWHLSLLKLLYVISRITLTLGQEGFCRPPEEMEGEDRSSGQTKDVDGTGMGQGSGEKNVSNEIEDEEQVEGLQDEKEEEAGGDDGDEKQDEEDDAVEMSNDFDGKTEDVKQKEGEDQKDQEDQEEEDAEDKADDLDPLDPSTVDEKFWADENKEEGKDDDGDEKVEEGVDNKDETSEMAARDEKEHKQDKKEKDSTKEQDAGEQVEDEKDETKEEEGDDDDMDETGSHQGDNLSDDDNPAQDDQQNVDIPEGDLLDLPDDVNLGDDNKDNSEEEDPENNDEAIADDVSMHEDEIDDEKVEDNDVKQNGEQDKQDETEPMETDEAHTMQNDQAENDTSMMQTDGADGAQDGKGALTGDSAKEDEKPQKEESDENELGDQEANEDNNKEQPSVGQAESRFGDGDADDQDATSRVSQKDIQSQRKTNVNPLRSLGDAMQEWMRKLEGIEDSATEEKPESTEDIQRDTAMTYVEDGNDDDLQATGAATEGQVDTAGNAQLGDEKLPDDDDDKKDEDLADGKKNDDEDMESDDNIKALHLIPDEESQDPMDVWRKYNALTNRLQIELTEQLRLILEPTLATRLKGDYRTGKRLNMRKVIPYIASDFTKDKIWLRRSRPSGRAYQVLLAVDDSQSMGNSNVVNLAFQTLALVSGSLRRLEVGEVGVTRFGKDVNQVHALDGGPVTDEKGAEIVRQFRFDQRSTNVHALLQHSLEDLSKARDRRSFGTDLWQLMIIISDGILQDIEEISALLRKAREQKIFIVFLVVDCLKQNNDGSGPSTSIMDLQDFIVDHEDPPGRIVPYLDKFPFEHYVVLQDVENLPDVLCATMRQFFERASFEG